MNTQQKTALEALVNRALTTEEEITVGAAVDARSDGVIAELLSQNRTKLVHTEVGNGTILEVLGLATGNVLIDLITTEPSFRHVKPLVEQGRLRLDAALVRNTLQSLVPAVLTQAQATALLNVAAVPDPVSTQAVSDALNKVGV